MRARTWRNNSSRAETRSRAVFDCGKLETTSQSAREAPRDARAALCAKVGRPCADNNLSLPLSAGLFSTLRAADARDAIRVSYVARRCGIKNARTSSPQLIRVIYARKSLEAISIISCRAHCAFADFLVAMAAAKALGIFFRSRGSPPKRKPIARIYIQFN